MELLRKGPWDPIQGSESMDTHHKIRGRSAHTWMSRLTWLSSAPGRASMQYTQNTNHHSLSTDLAPTAQGRVKIVTHSTKIIIRSTRPRSHSTPGLALHKEEGKQIHTAPTLSLSYHKTRYHYSPALRLYKAGRVWIHYKVIARSADICRARLTGPTIAESGWVRIDAAPKSSLARHVTPPHGSPAPFNARGRASTETRHTQISTCSPHNWISQLTWPSTSQGTASTDVRSAQIITYPAWLTGPSTNMRTNTRDLPSNKITGWLFIVSSKMSGVTCVFLYIWSFDGW
jgi:hypothetical protein